MWNGNRPPRACARACDSCQRKRAKCSGTKPCERCVTNDEECSFQPHVRELKASLRARIQALEKGEREAQTIFEVLRGGEHSDGSRRAVLDSLRDNVPLDVIAAGLSRTANDDSIASGICGDDDDVPTSSLDLSSAPTTQPYSDTDSIPYRSNSAAHSSISSGSGGTGRGLQFSPVSSTTSDAAFCTMPPLQEDLLSDPKCMQRLDNLPWTDDPTYAALDYWPFDDGATCGVGGMPTTQQGPPYEISESMTQPHSESLPRMPSVYDFDPLAGGDLVGYQTG